MQRRLELATVVSGEIEALGENSFMLLNTLTTVTNTGTAALGNVTVDMPMPETMIVEFIDIVQPAQLETLPTLGSEVPQGLIFDAISDTRPIEDMPRLLPGESFSFSVGYRFLVGGVDPLALTDMMAFGEATIDREGDGAPDFAIIAKAAPTLLAEDGGIELVERLLEVQLDTQVAAAIAPSIGEAQTPAEPTEDRIIITTTDQDVSASLSTSGFMPAADGEVLITETIEAENSADATLAAIEETLLATDPMVSDGAEAEPEVMPMVADETLESLETLSLDGNGDISGDSDGEAMAMVSTERSVEDLPPVTGSASTYESVDEMLAAIDEVMTDEVMTDDAMADDAMIDDVMIDDVMIDDVMVDDIMIDDIMIDDVMIDDVMAAETGLDDGFDDSGFADFNDPVQQFQQEQMSYEQAGGQPAPTLYQSAPVQQQRFVRPPKLVRKLIPGPKIAFPAGSVPVTLTTGFQLAVPEGFQAYQAPDGSFFLMRKQ